MLERDAASQREEVRDTNREVTGRARQIALRPVGGERDRVAVGSGADFEIGRGVVDDEIRGIVAVERVVEAVDFDGERIARDRQARDADDAEVSSTGLESRPRNVFAINLAFEQREREVHAGEAEAHRVTGVGGAVHAHEGIHTRTADGEEFGRHFVTVGEGDGLFRLLKSEATRELHEAEEIEVHVAGGAHHFAVGGGQADRALAVRAGRDGQRHRGVIDQRVVFGVLVDRDGDRVRFDRQAVDADERGAAGFGLEGAPAAFRVVLVRLDDPREAHVAEFKTEARFAVFVGEADEGVHAVGTHGEALYFDRRAVAQFRFAVALAEGDITGELHEAVKVHFHPAAGAEQRTVLGIKLERERLGAARHHVERRCREVDHVGLVGRIDFDLAVDFHRQGLHFERHARDADKRSRVRGGEQRVPLARDERLGIFVAQFLAEVSVSKIDARE